MKKYIITDCNPEHERYLLGIITRPNNLMDYVSTACKDHRCIRVCEFEGTFVVDGIGSYNGLTCEYPDYECIVASVFIKRHSRLFYTRDGYEIRKGQIVYIKGQKWEVVHIRTHTYDFPIVCVDEKETVDTFGAPQLKACPPLKKIFHSMKLVLNKDSINNLYKMLEEMQGREVKVTVETTETEQEEGK